MTEMLAAVADGLQSWVGAGLRHLAWRILAVVVAAAVLLVSLMAAAAATFFALAPVFEPPLAALVTAGIGVGLAVVIGFVAIRVPWTRCGRRARPAVPTEAIAPTTKTGGMETGGVPEAALAAAEAAEAVAVLANRLQGVVRDHPGALLLVALAAGVAVGNTSLRRFLTCDGRQKPTPPR
ncbi:MAG: hypothetical protein H7840_13680 [Alphaproteobacteria bacterium]